jgi:DNA-binding NarL/FixJ family response regulator
MAGDAEIKSALDAGARGYLLKSMPPKELVDVIRHVHAGKTYVPTTLATCREMPPQPQASRARGGIRRALNLYLRKRN